MQYVTEEYRQEMKLPYRGASSVYAYIGLINEEAQKSAEITSSFSGDESHLYDIGGLVTSTENDGSITFTFGDYYELNIAGLTINFNTVPSSITVTNGDKTATYQPSGAEYTFSDGYTDCHYLKITPDSGKLSITKITFGIGVYFTNREIISTTRENEVSHISNELPRKTFTLTVNNRSNLFNKDNPYGYAPYLEERQVVSYEYGRELTNGSIYKIKGGKVLLKNWSSDDYEAKFTCVGYLDFLDGQYYKGKFYDDGISAYDLAEEVFADAGITNYVLDESMKKVAIYNPIPVCEYREALKMIANASRCVLFEDRDGNICMTNAKRPSYIHTTTFYGATDYSIPSAIFNDNSAYNYADAELEYAMADGTLLFLPENTAFMQVGFVSSEVANSSGLFTNDPHMDVSFKSEFELKRLFLNFAVVIPTSVTVTCSLQGTVVDTQTLTNLSLTTVYTYSGKIDAITVRFNGAQTNQRIHLNNIEIDGKIDYDLTYHELKNTPIASSLERVSKVNVHTYQYNLEKTEEGTSKSSYVKVDTTPNEDGGDTIDVTTGTSDYGSAISTIQAEIGDNTVIFNQPYYNYKVTAGTIKEYGAFYLVVNSTSAQEIDVYAQPYSVTDNIYSIDIHEKGVEKDSRNKLISTNIMAKTQAEWLRDYYDDDLEYDLTYRGDPILDADDLIYLDNKFVKDNEVRIEEETINTSMGMNFTCKLRARRTSFMTDATLGKFIVGKAKLGETL